MTELRAAPGDAPGPGRNEIGPGTFPRTDAGRAGCGPALSVVVPARGREASLQALLASLGRSARAADWPVEIIVVDDASAPPLSPASPDGATLRLLRSDRRLGANGARRLGLAAAQGRYVHFHDSDDDVAPDWAAALRDAAASGADILLTARRDASRGVESYRRQVWLEANAGRPDRVRRMLAFRNCLGPFGGVTFARSSLEGVRFADIASSQDWTAFCDVYRRDPRLTVAHTHFIYRLDGDDRISASPRRKTLGMFAIIRRTRADSPLGAWHRYYHLHYFRRWIRDCNRPALDRILRRVAAQRRLAYAAAFLYMIGALKWR